MKSILAFECGNPTSNLSLSKIEYQSGSPSTSNLFSESVFLKCMKGFIWSDNLLVKNISCQSTGIWSGVAACSGILI